MVSLPSRLISSTLLALVAWAAFAVAAEDEPAANPLADEHRRFLEETALLLTDEERAAFDQLERNYRREAFIESFWRTRDPFPETGRNEFREDWMVRIELARARYGTLDADRSRVLMLAGPPNRLETNPCPTRLAPIDIWLYDAGRSSRGSFSVVFVRKPGRGGDPFRIWTPTEGLRSLLDWTSAAGQTSGDLRQSLVTECPRGGEILAHIFQALDWQRIRDSAGWLPEPSDEWVGAFLARGTDLPESADTFAAELSVSYPGRYQSRTVVQGLISVPVEEGRAADPTYNFQVDGEVLREGQLFEEFRYRFDIAASEVSGNRVPLVIQRFLRPGTYKAILKVQDISRNRFFRVEEELEVPRVEPRETVVAAAAPAPAPRARGDSFLGEANAGLDGPDASLTLLPPTGGLLTGRVRVQARAEGEMISKVAFELNGQRVMAKSRPPYSVELDLGGAPRFHTLEAVGFDDKGREVARDELPLNVGPHRFGIRLVEPRPHRRYSRSLRAAVEVDLPLGANLDRLELYLNDDLLATLYQPPFVQPILIPPDQEVTYVRAVAYLDDGNMSEDLVFINSPPNLDAIDVDFVELYTSVTDKKGRPVEGLTKDDFRVFEDGTEQKIQRFERVRDQPIYAGIMIDASLSMVEELDQAEGAALKFFERVLEPRDRAAVFVFADVPQLKVPLTNSIEILAGGLAGVEAEGETALYDAIVESVYYFAGIRGKRALILLTDGQDSNSRATFAETLDFARRSGIAIYSIGIDLAQRDVEVKRVLQRLARETGGAFFFTDRVSQLDRIYQQIEEELRTQYLIGYQSTQLDESSFREVRVEVLERGLEAKTIPGYFP